jgi:serine-type D-Ala-D-Ala carboxypeptidase
MLKSELESQVSQFITTAIKNKTFPAAEILMAKGEEVLFHQSFGNRNPNDDSTTLVKNSLFDLASLTKPLATTCAIMHLYDQKHLALGTSLLKIIPEFEDCGGKQISIKHLLTHTSGLPDWIALYEPEFNKQKGWSKLMKTPLSQAPGEKTVYSCLGFILLGEIIRRISGNSLKDYCTKHIFTPLGLEYTEFNPRITELDIVSTGFCELRKIELTGIVHDENAALFDGEGGNSGLFGTAGEIYRICRMLLCGGRLAGTRILSEESVDLLFTNHNRTPLTPRSLGWDIKIGKADYWSCSNEMPEGSIGHLGFTGTSLWVDPKSQLIIIVLSNRVFISREKNIPLMRSFRPELHKLLLRYLK